MSGSINLEDIVRMFTGITIKSTKWFIKYKELNEAANIISDLDTSANVVKVNTVEGEALVGVLKSLSTKVERPASSWLDKDIYVLQKKMSVDVYKRGVSYSFDFNPSLMDVMDAYDEIKEEIFKIKI